MTLMAEGSAVEDPLAKFRGDDKTAKPELKDLLNYVIPKYAPYWKEIGKCLHFKSETLKIIKCDNLRDTEGMCRVMFTIWLQKNVNASWDELFKALDQAIASGLKALSDIFIEAYKKEKSQSQDDHWPPDRPKVFVNLELIRLKGKQDFTKMPIKNISEIFTSSQKSILIEGAPGIGKTALARKIAYCWANGEILVGMKLFLLHTRDPKLHSVDSVSCLVHYLGDNHLSRSKVKKASKRLKEIKGSGVIFVIDSYDECPPKCKFKAFVDQLYNREFLSECTVVITSRPTASLSLHDLDDQRIKILGLTKSEQNEFVAKSLEDPEMILKLQEYLRDQPIINSLIHVPLHLSILLYLFKKHWLPETLTEMNEYFIVHTIYRNLMKAKPEQIQHKTVSKITDLPEPELTVVHQLSKLAYEGLQKNQFTFTYDKLEEICSNINNIPGALNGFGLLKSLTEECYYQKPGAGNGVLFSFLHLTMQEYLAALHLSILSPTEQQFKYICFCNQFGFMWIMYIGIMGARLHCFLDIVNSICHRQSKNSKKLGILFIFQCFLERKETLNNELNELIASVFNDGSIDLSHITLPPHYVTLLITFITKSSIKWKSLNLSGCFLIGSEEIITTLTRFFIDFKEKLSTIQYINLSNNNLSSLWGSHTDVDKDDMAETALLSVESLDLSFNKFNGNEFKKLFSALNYNNKLRKLNVSGNNISVDTASNISECLKVNQCLNELNLSVNSLEDKGAEILAEAIKFNKTLQILDISRNSISKKGIMDIMEACTKTEARTLCQLVCTLNNLSEPELSKITGYIRKENAVQIFHGSWNSIYIKDFRLVINTTIQYLDLQQKSQSCSDNIKNVQDALWYMNTIAEYEAVLKNCFEEYLKQQQQSLYLQNVYVEYIQIKILCDCLKANNTIIDLNLSSDEPVMIMNKLYKISDYEVPLISECLMINKTLRTLNLSGNKITDIGVEIIAEAIANLKILNLSGNNITDQGANMLGQNIHNLQELDISKNWISKEGIMIILEACTTNKTLHKLVCTHSNLSKSELDAINEYIVRENAVKIFEASWNSIDSRLNIVITFQSLDLRQKPQPDSIRQDRWHFNKITDLENRKKFLHCYFKGEQIIKLQGICCWCLEDKKIDTFDDRGFWMVFQSSEMANNNDDDSDNVIVEVISDCIKVNKTLTEFTLSECKITDAEIETFAKAIEVNTTLQSLDISHSKIRDNGVRYISNCLKVNKSVCKLNLSGNEITDNGVKILVASIDALEELTLSENEITDKGINNLAESIRFSKVLKTLNISKNWISREGVMRILMACQRSKLLHKLVCTHNNLLQYEVVAINEYITKQKVVQIFDTSWNSIDDTMWKNTIQVSIKTTFHLLDLQQEQQLDSYYNNAHHNMYDCQYMNKLTSPNYKAQVLYFCFAEYLNKQCISLKGLHIKDFEMEIISDCLKLNNTITNLNLSGCLAKFKIESALNVICFLKVNNTLCELNLSNNGIEDAVVEALSDVVIKNITLQRLDLSCNCISDYGTSFICECLQVNNTLCGLDLSMNNVANEGVTKLAIGIQMNTALQELNISKNHGISKTGIMRLLEACTQNKTLHKLVCTHCNLSHSESTAIYEYAKEQSTLQVLVSSWNSIGIKDSKLTVITTCQSLDVKQNTYDHISKKQWFVSEILRQHRREFLRHCFDSMQSIDLQRIPISTIVIFCDCLKTNNTLFEINLSNNNITDEDVEKLTEAIKVNTTVQILDISCNKIRDEGINALNNCLKINNMLRKLNISKNIISDYGAEHLAEAITINKALKELNISKNLISKNGIMKIVEACAKNKTLYKLVCRYNNLSKSGVETISGNIEEKKALQIFDTSYNSIIINVNKLAIKTTLYLLDVSQNIIPSYDDNGNIQEKLWYVDEITEVEYRREFLLCSFESEQKINLQSIRMTDDIESNVISGLLNMTTKLVELNLSNNKIAGKEVEVIFKAIEENETLENLDMSQNTITCDETSAICNCLVNNCTLCKLNLSKNHIADDGAKTIAAGIQYNTSLKELNVSSNWITKEGVMAIAKGCRALQKLVCTCNNISETGLEDIHKCIREKNTVKKFYASWNSICTVQNKLNIKTTFQVLDLELEMQSSNELDQNCQEEFWYSDEIVDGKHRKEFLDCCFEECLSKSTFDLHNTNMTNFELEILSNCFQRDFTLTKLSFNNCLTNDNNNGVILAISSCLRNSLSKTLCELNLSNNQITDCSMESLVESIGVDTNLQNLDISGNIITDNGVLILGTFLKTNGTLCSLNLSGNQITDIGLETLSEAVENNTTLQRLDISGNCITDRGAVSFAKAIKLNTALQELCISKNRIGIVGVTKILEACIKNITLLKLVCTHNNLSKSAINEYLKKGHLMNDYVKRKIKKFLFVVSWNSLCTENGRLCIKTTLHVDQELHTDEDSYIMDINIPIYKDLLHCCLEEYLDKQCVDLQDVEITNVGIKILSHCLESNKVLVDLNISNYNKSASAKLDDIVAISNCLKRNNTLCKLNLSGNYVTNEGAECLAEALQENTALQVLNLSKNMITYEGIMKILKACRESGSLQVLVCSHNMMLKYQLFIITEYIEKEKVVKIFESSWNSLCIKNNTLGVEVTLQTLQLGNDDVYKKSRYMVGTKSEYCQHQFIHCYTEYLNAKSISLQNVVLKDFEVLNLVCYLKFNETLNELILSNCRCGQALTFSLIITFISDYLKTNCTLCKLNLSSNKVADDQMNILAEGITMNKTLEILDLSYTIISYEGIRIISNCLKNNESLVKLNLSESNITDYGAVALSKAIETNLTLQELDISKNWISKDGVMFILVACTKHRTLNKLVCTYNNLTESGLAAISEYNRKENAVQIFYASWNCIYATKHSLAIETTLQLFQSYTDSIKKDLWYLNEIPKQCYRTELLMYCLEEYWNDQCIDTKCRMDKFEVEILNDCLKINNTLVDLDLLYCVKIKSCNSATVNVNTDVNVYTKLQKLQLSNTIIDDNILFISNCLGTNKTLRELDLSRNDITNEGIKKVAEAIQVNTTLQVLNVSKNLITKYGVMRILKACAKNKTLHKLVSTHNSLSKSGLAAINLYIREMNAVQIFDVSWNSLSIINNKLAIWRTFQVIKAKQLQYDDKTNEVQQKSSVKSTKWYGVENLVLDNKREFLYCCFEEFLNERSVSLQNTQMNDFEIEVFSVCLKNNKTLIELNLSNCLIFDSNKTVGIVIEALKRNSTLRILNFSDNHIGDDGAKVLVKSITTNVVLQKLDLSNNEISDSGVSSFKDYLKINKKLQELNLSRNRITDKGAKSLAEGIQENTTLLELNVSKNLINKEGIMFLVEACAKNRALNKLVCTHNNLSKSELEVIIKYISETIAIQIFIASWNSVCTKFGKLAIKTTIQVIDVNSDDRNTQEDFWCVNEIKTLQHRKKFLFRCFESENSVIIHGSISMLEIELISDCLRTNKTLTDLTLSQAKFTDEELGKFMEAIKVNIMLQSIDISHNLITENGASIIINNIGKLRKLNISNNKINDEGAKRIAEAIQVNKTLQELNISKNFISKEGVFTILEACAQTRTLHKLVCTHNNLSNFGLKAINEYIIKMKAVKTFDASWNSISTKYGVLAIITTFQFLNVKQNLPADDHGIWKELWFLNEIQKVYMQERFSVLLF